MRTQISVYKSKHMLRVIPSRRHDDVRAQLLSIAEHSLHF